MCKGHIFFVGSSVGGHLGWFPTLTVVNSVTMNIGSRISKFGSLGLYLYLGMKLLDYMIYF